MTTGKSGSDAQDGSNAAVRARILAMRQAKQQQASSSSALLGVPGYSSQLQAPNVKHLSWYATEEDDEDGGDSVNVHGSADGTGEDESTIHGHHSQHVTYRPASQASTTSALTTSSGRRADSSSASRPETSMSLTRPDTAASMYSATNIHTRERAANLLNEIEAELQAQRSGSPILRSLTPPVGPPSVPLPDLPPGPSSHRSSSGSSLARTRALNGSSTSLGSVMSSDSSIGPMPTTPLPPLPPPPPVSKQQQQRLAQRRPSAGILSPDSSNPTSPISRAFSMRRGSASAAAPQRGPPPSVPLPPTPTMHASGHGRHPSVSSTRSSVSAAPLSRAASNAASADRERVGQRDTIISSSGSASPRNSMSSFSRSPLGQPEVEDISENSDEALSDVLNLSPRTSPSSVFQSLQPPPVPVKSGRDWTTTLSPSLANPKQDDEERRRRSLMHKSMGGLVAALTEEAQAWTSSPHNELERPPSPSARSASPSLGHETARSSSDARNKPTPGATLMISSPLYSSPDHSTSNSSGASSMLFTAPVSAPANISQLRPPVISVDDANSDTDDSDDSGDDGPRKRRKQRKPKARFNFEDQRAAAPSRQGSNAMLSPAVQSDASQWAYYQFSPDLPPYVPPGMRPTDLTGRGTWRSIAARAGGLTSARNSSVTLGSDAADSRSSTPSGPVSMREVAAQARAQVERANSLRERQHSLLAQRSFLPIDIHSHASEHATSERGSVLGSSSASLFSFDSSLRQGDADTLSMVSDTFSLHGVGYADVASRSSAGVGTESPDRTSTGTLIGLGIQAKPAEPVKKYVDMAMQTSPTSSPEPSPPGTPTLAPMRSEMGVGGDSAREIRRHASIITGKSQLVWSDNEDAAAGGEVRASTPTQRRAAMAQRSTPSLSARASRARISAIPDLDDPSAWPVRLSVPRLGSRRSQLSMQGTPSRLSRMSSRLSIASSALSESTIGPDSDSDSDESDLDVSETLETLAERSGALDLTARGAKRKLHARPSPADSLSAIGARKIAPAPRSRLSTLPAQKSSLAARASRLSKASTCWGSSDEEEHGDDEHTEAEGSLRTPAVIVRVLPGRSVAPATVGRASFVTTPLRPAMSLRQTASVANSRTPRRSVRMSRMQRPSNQAFDLVLKPSLVDADAESLLADDIDTLPQLDDDDFMPASLARLTKSASSSPVVRQEPAPAPAAAAAPQVSAALISTAVAKLSLSTPQTPAKQTGSTGMLIASPYGEDASTSGASPVLPSPSNASDRRHSNSIDDTPSTHLGSELWSHAGDRRSFGTTATSVSENSVDGKATAASLENSPLIEQEATMRSPTVAIVPIKPLTIKKLSDPKVEAPSTKAVEPVKPPEPVVPLEITKEPTTVEASGESKSPERAKAPEAIVATELKPSLTKSRSALPTPRKRATSTVSESGTATARTIESARSASPATKALPAPRGMVAPRTSTSRPPPSSYTGIRPPSSASMRSRSGSQSGIARPSGLKTPAPALKVETSNKAPTTPEIASAKSSSPTLRRMKSCGDQGSIKFVAPALSTLPSVVTRKAVDYSPILGSVALPRAGSPARRTSPPVAVGKTLPTPLKARPSLSSLPPPTPAKSLVPPTTPGKSALLRRANNASAPGSALPRPSGIATPRGS